MDLGEKDRVKFIQGDVHGIVLECYIVGPDGRRKSDFSTQELHMMTPWEAFRRYDIRLTSGQIIRELRDWEIEPEKVE